MLTREATYEDYGFSEEEDKKFNEFCRKLEMRDKILLLQCAAEVYPKEELKQIYDIFADCWRLYKRLYPPSRPEDDTYWQGMMKELEVLRKNYHHSRLCEDLLCAVVRDLETKSKRSNPAASMKE